MAERTVVTICPKCSNKPHSQDLIYKEGLRVHNRKPNSQLACTVCGNVKGEIKIVAETNKKSKK